MYDSNCTRDWETERSEYAKGYRDGYRDGKKDNEEHYSYYGFPFATNAMNEIAHIKALEKIGQKELTD